MFIRGISVAVFAVIGVAFSLSSKDNIDPVQLHYKCIESESGDSKSPILLLHGLSGWHGHWKGVDEALANHTKRRVCAVDLRNHGDSPWSNQFDIETLAIDIGHFLDQQNMRKVNLIGHSLGGKTSVHFTLNNPSRVDSIVVEDMRPNGIVEEALTGVKAYVDVWEAAVECASDDASENEARDQIFNCMNKILEENGAEKVDNNFKDAILLRRVDGRWRTKWNIEVSREALENIEEMLTNSNGTYPGPALFIYGTESAFAVGEDESNIRRLFPKAELHPIQGAGHTLHGVYQEFNDAVINLLEQVN